MGKAGCKGGCPSEGGQQREVTKEMKGQHWQWVREVRERDRDRERKGSGASEVD